MRRPSPHRCFLAGFSRRIIALHLPPVAIPVVHIFIDLVETLLDIIDSNPVFMWREINPMLLQVPLRRPLRSIKPASTPCRNVISRYIAKQVDVLGLYENDVVVVHSKEGVAQWSQ